jgi:hypothetical protein
VTSSVRGKCWRLSVEIVIGAVLMGITPPMHAAVTVLALSEAQKQEDVFPYQRTIKQAFRSVSDALIGLQKYREFREQEANLTASAEECRKAGQTSP